jgi:CRP-like cAMP-binding protein
MTVFDQLAMHPAVADLPGDWLHQLAACGREVTWPAWTRLLRERDTADAFWLIRSGVVELDFHLPGLGDLPIERIGAGSLLGWSWLIPPYRSTLGVLVVEQCAAIELRAAPVRELIAGDPVFGAAFTTRVLAGAAQRLRAARRRAIDLQLPARHAPSRPQMAQTRPGSPFG